MYKNWWHYILLNVEGKQFNFAYVSACICLSPSLVMARDTVLLCLGVWLVSFVSLHAALSLSLGYFKF